MENVQAFFEKEKACKPTINRMAVAKRTAEATRLSERTVRDIHKEHVARDGQVLTPVKRYTASRIRINPDTFDREAIRRLVHAFYIRRKYPTIAAVLEKAGVWLSRRQILPLESTKRNGVYIQETRRTKNTYTNRQTYWNKDTHTYRLYTN